MAAVAGCQLTVKSVLMRFPHPLFLSTMHFSSAWAVGTLCQFLCSSNAPTKVKTYDAEWMLWYATRILPVVLAMFSSVSINNAALLYIGAGLNSIISILTPVSTACLAAVFGTQIPRYAWLGIGIVIIGDAVVTVDAVHSYAHRSGTAVLAVAMGIALSLLAMVFRSTKSVLQDHLMNPYSDTGGVARLGPLELWALQAPCLAIVSLFGSLIWDRSAPWLTLPVTDSSTLLLLAISCACAVVVNVGGLYCIRMLGATASQIAGKLNILITPALAFIFHGESSSVAQMIGVSIMIVGAMAFERAQIKGKALGKSDADDQKRLLCKDAKPAYV